MASVEDTERSFEKACLYVETNHAKLNSDLLTDLYGFFKQATVGKCNVPKPSVMDFRSNHKWKSWSKLGDMSKKEAMQHYVQRVIDVAENWGDEIVSQSKSKESWVVISSLGQEEIIPESVKDIYDWVREGRLDKIKKCHKKISLDLRDDQGLTLLHWAVDRGHLDVVRYLIKEVKYDVNCRDGENQTPLHYAAACGHSTVCKFLIDSGANVNVTDNNNLTPKDVAETPSIKLLLSVADNK